jgi:hypothetical protein
LKKAGELVSSMVKATAAAVVVVELLIGAAGLRIESRISVLGGSSEAVGAQAGVAEVGSSVLCARRRSRVSRLRVPRMVKFFSSKAMSETIVIRWRSRM